MLPSMLWTFTTEYLYLLKNPFFGYCQDVIYLVFLQRRVITDRKLVISVYAMKQLI